MPGDGDPEVVESHLCLDMSSVMGSLGTLSKNGCPCRWWIAITTTTTTIVPKLFSTSSRLTCLTTRSSDPAPIGRPTAALSPAQTATRADIMSSIEKPYSEACEENKRPILGVIGPLFREARRLLEIGSGTGQHAVFFAEAMPHLIWQTSDCMPYLPGIHAWLDEAALPNLPPTLPLNVLGRWPEEPFDAVYSANTAHIMSEREVAAMFAGVGSVLVEGGYFALYGPFNIGGRFTSESNARFDAMFR